MHTDAERKYASKVARVRRATLISVNSLFFSVGMIVLFPLAGVLADQWGLTAVLVGIGVALFGFTAGWNLWAGRK